MAKMFYSLEEAAEKLGRTVDQVKQMAIDDQLQQFRDRDKLMFKVDQVDALAAPGKTAGDTAGTSTGPIPLADGGDTDTIDVGASGTTAEPRKDDPRQSTGVSVFDSGEVESVDPSAKTNVTGTDDEELALESVGSGSGLLDLTREGDDTSLGAELLDEIYPGGGESPDTKMGSGIGSSGVFESAIGTGITAVGLESPGPVEQPVMPAAYAPDDYDAPGSGLSAGMLLGASACLIIALIVAISAVIDVPSRLTAIFAQTTNSVLMWGGILLVGCIVLGVIGLFIGKAQEK